MLGAKILSRIEEERGRFLHWAPLFLALGIGLYFTRPQEPTHLSYAVAICVMLCALSVSVTSATWTGPIARALFLCALGFLVAGARAHLVGAPVLDYRYYGTVEGRIIIIDRSQSDAVRLTLDHVQLDNVRLSKIPKRVRISLHGEQGYLTPEIGARVAMTAHLSGPNGPVEPGGFDFQRMAWFRGIGAVGYTRVPALLLAPPQGKTQLVIGRLREAISAWVRTVLPGETGAFAAAITTGDRAAMSRETIAALRGSNLAHLLAISGLHMGLLTGFVFQAARRVLSLSSYLSLNFRVKKLAAILAIIAGMFYLALSGGAIATERAFIMVTTMFVAILFDRRALSLRAVALAAVVVLLLTPEALSQPGFQMSFAATTALVFVFGWLRDRARNETARRLPKWARPVAAVVISSAVAGLATAPIGAAHFNQISHYGLIANLVSVPIMGAVIMPLAVLAALLAPIGVGWLPVKLMGPAIQWILSVAQWVSDLEGAIGKIHAPPDAVLTLLGLGGVLIVLLRQRERLAGLAVCAAGFLMWTFAERPPVLISGEAGLVGVMTPQGRALSKPKGQGFAASSWLENDGDHADQKRAASRVAFGGVKGQLTTQLGAHRLVQLTGRGAVDRLEHACATADVVILSAWLNTAPPSGCIVFDKVALQDTGAVALWDDDGALRITPTRAPNVQRLWTN